MKKRIWEFVKANFDFSILILSSFIFVIWGFLGAGEDVLNPVTIALLGVLAISQMRSRQQVSDVAQTWHRARTDLLLKDFPTEYKEAQRSVSYNYFFAGITMNRTLQIMRSDIIRVLSKGGSVRILLPDPTYVPLMQMIAATRPLRSAESIQSDIENSIRSARELESQGDLQIRTVRFLPGVGINAMDLDSPKGSIMVQVYEFAPENEGEASPIFFLTGADRTWYDHYKNLIERLWQSGKKS